MVKAEVIIDRLSFLATLDPSRPLIGSPESGFRMDLVSLESNPTKFVFFLCTYSQRDLLVLLRRGGMILSFHRL